MNINTRVVVKNSRSRLRRRFFSTRFAVRFVGHDTSYSEVSERTNRNMPFVYELTLHASGAE